VTWASPASYDQLLGPSDTSGKQRGAHAELEKMTRRRIIRDSPIPYYAQLVEIIVEAIDEGRWRAGDLIPSEAELIAKYKISRTVIRNALDLLSNQGRVRRIKGKGSMVMEPLLWYGSPALAGPYEALAASYTLREVVDNRLHRGDDALRARLGVAPSASLLRIVVMSERSDRPGVAATLSSFDVAGDASPALEQLTKDGSTPQFHVGGLAVPVQLATDFGLQLSDSPTTLSVASCTASEARLLRVRRGVKVFCFEWVTYDAAGRVIVSGRSLSADNPRLRFVVRHSPITQAPRSRRSH
jgi:DNA-binding GntR family transcriptional regulator